MSCLVMKYIICYHLLYELIVENAHLYRYSINPGNRPLQNQLEIIYRWPTRIQSETNNFIGVWQSVNNSSNYGGIKWEIILNP